MDNPQAERIAKMNAFLVPHLLEEYQKLRDDISEIYNERNEEIHQSVLHAVSAGVEAVKRQPGKGQISYLHFSYLLSGAFSDEQLIKIDFYNNSYFKDLKEIDCYWDYSDNIPDLRKNIDRLEAQLRKKFPRVKAYELEELFFAFRIYCFPSILPILRDVAQNTRFADAVREIQSEQLQVFFGGYLSNSEILHTIKKGDVV